MSENQIIIVTGSAQGIGFAVAQKIVEAGSQVIIADFNEEAGQGAVKKLGTRAHFKRLNVSSKENWEQLFDDVIAEFGRVDGLVNSAGITGGSDDVEHEALDDWDLVFDVNVKGTFLGSQQAMKHMVHGGAIVNISSLAGLYAEPVAVAYSASKGAVRMLTKHSALYGATKEHPIRVNTVYPGSTKTPMVEEITRLQPEVMQAQLNKVPLKEFADPMDIANMVYYLISDQARYITGGDFVVDGGMSAGF